MSAISCVLSIAGSDSGGGAGIQADLRAFRAFHTFGATAITAITAQNPAGVRSIAPVPAKNVADQIHAVLEGFPVKAIKTGMLFSAEIVETVCDILEQHAAIPVIVDPVMISTSGTALLHEDAQETVIHRLLPRADWITPNLPEAELLLGRELTSFPQTISAGLELSERFQAGIVIKGGHSADPDKAEDLVCYQGTVWRLSAPRLAFPPYASHGTGCTFSAALAAALASGLDAGSALIQVKSFIQISLQQAVSITDSLGVMPPALAAPFPADEIIMEKL